MRKLLLISISWSGRGQFK